MAFFDSVEPSVGTRMFLNMRILLGKNRRLSFGVRAETALTQINAAARGNASGIVRPTQSTLLT
jgi:hypothetical protein